MDLILFSNDDDASLNILNNLKNLVNFEYLGKFENNEYYKFNKFYVIIIDQEKVRAENIDIKIKNSLSINFENIIVASKHRSESGMRSLTVHPIGNFGRADLGGKDKTLVSVNANYMTGALLKLNEIGKDINYNISYEATHHGPYLSTPTFFIEIGSNYEEWNDQNSGKIIAETIIKTEKTNDEIAIGIGGGHYTPRFTKLALTKKISFGHMAPKYAAEKIDLEMLLQMKEKCNAKYLIMEKKDLSGKERKRIEDLLDQADLELIDSDSLPDRS
ncbi:MAG: D-aminoacyl-tRNA deacylase [Thermoplasmata archaeon]|nr:D-aminoacyl-tRNA deacylase [Thermoplasmata archaeon]